jgi:hypothetical protein
VTDAVADPTRANAANEYLQSLKEQIELAGKLTGEVKKTTKAVDSQKKKTKEAAKESEESKKKEAAKESEESKTKEAAKESEESKTKEAAKESEESKKKEAAKESEESKTKEAAKESEGSKKKAATGATANADPSSDPAYMAAVAAGLTPATSKYYDFIKDFQPTVAATPTATGKEAIKNQQLEVLNQMNGSLKSIEREMTR